MKKKNVVQFCKKCVISNYRPSSTVEFQNNTALKRNYIKFNDEGICSACQYAEIKLKIDWKKREEELIKLLDKYRSKDGSYDVVVPGSGGKDSAFTAHVLKYKYGMNPLTVTWAPHLYTDIGWRNFENWMHVGGLDNLLFTPNGKLHRLLTKLAFVNLLHPFQPFIIGQKLVGPKVASKFKIKLVFYGENQAEYGNNIKENFNPEMNTDFFSKKSEKIILGGKTINYIIKNYKYNLSDFNPYIPEGLKVIKQNKIKFYYLGYYLKWDPQEVYYYASQNTGFSANTERTQGTYSKYSSIDDKIDYFHYYTTLIKFGLGRASYDASQEVRNGKITRDEAVYLVKKYDNEFPDKFFKDFLDYVNMSEKDFFTVIEKFRNKLLWKKTKKKWSLKYKVYG